MGANIHLVIHFKTVHSKYLPLGISEFMPENFLIQSAILRGEKAKCIKNI